MNAINALEAQVADLQARLAVAQRERDQTEADGEAFYLRLKAAEARAERLAGELGAVLKTVHGLPAGLGGYNWPAIATSIRRALSPEAPLDRAAGGDPGEAPSSPDDTPRRPWRIWWFGSEQEDSRDGVFIEDADEQPIGHSSVGEVSRFDLPAARLIVAAVNAFAPASARPTSGDPGEPEEEGRGMKGRRRLYDYQQTEAVRRRIPVEVRQALEDHGWNALGVYEAVKEALADAASPGSARASGEDQA